MKNPCIGYEHYVLFVLIQKEPKKPRAKPKADAHESADEVHEGECAWIRV